MIATLPRAVLAPLLKRAAEVATKKSTQPILGQVHLRVDGGRLHISATDLERALTTSVECEGKHGEACVPAKELSNIVDRMPRADVTLRLHESLGKPPRLKVSAGRSSFDLVAMNGTAFPAMPKTDEVDLAPLAGAAIRDALDRAGYAASSDDNRPNLCTVRLGDGDAVATDGHRASWVQIDGLDGLTNTAVMVPADSLRELARVAADAESVDVGLDDTWFVMRAHGITVAARLYDGQYPDITQVMPTSFAFHATFKRDALLGALGRAKLFGDAPMSFRLAGRTEAILGVTARGEIPGIGSGAEFHEPIEMELDGTPPETVGASLPYLLDAVRAIQGEEVEMAGNTDIDPLLFSAPGDVKNRHIVMPMRT